MRRVAIVTGSSRGLGLALAAELKKEGYTVVGTSRIKGEDCSDWHLAGEITDEAFQCEVIDGTLARYGRIDLLVNNAGVGMYDSWEVGDAEAVREMFELNFFAVVALTNRVLPHLKASGGQIVNASSVAGKVALPYMGAYCASKYALNAYAASLRSELECSGVGVTNLIIGRVSTGFSLRSKGGKTPPQTPGRTTAQMYARHVIRGIVKRKHEVVFPGWYRYIIGFYALAPRFLERLARRRFEASPPFTQEEK